MTPTDAREVAISESIHSVGGQSLEGPSLEGQSLQGQSPEQPSVEQPALDAPSADGSVADPATAANATAVTRRIIKRYSNRKLYDTWQSRYVTLLQIAEMVREGEDVQIIDNASKEDKTDITLALIISEELKSKPRAIPLSTLRALIRNRGERLLTQLRESPIGRLMPAENKHAPVCTAPSSDPPDSMKRANSGDSAATLTEACDPMASPSPETPTGAIRRTLDQWQHSVDDRIRGIIPQFSNVGDLHREIERLTARVATLEQQLREESPSANGPSSDSSPRE